ncbi:quinone oxidoreductase [Neocucurbitaria cava]|uniref:Quinone oxidoreductase n=1 Tax=Neocucurbitaria cava TaxID=798079 RepID=A0A9W8Y213_9PLEO|nr:quinone oxidoreductase [Neocucurbitaria cava]
MSDPVLEGDNTTFSLETKILPSLGPDQVLVKCLYFSNDPAQRGWIQKDVDRDRLYTAPVEKGEVMRAFAIAEVVESNADSLKQGQLVLGTFGWTEYAVAGVKEVRPIQADDSAGIRPTHFIGALGGPGLTAYNGLIDVARATASDTVVVSGAAGATGSMVVQLAKHIVGCKKGHWHRWRIVACGAVATYNSMGETGIKNWFEIIINRIEVKGFIVTDAIESGKAGPWVQELIKYAKEGRIQIGPETETVVPTRFEDVPKTWMMLFKGGNMGKLLTQIQA